MSLFVTVWYGLQKVPKSAPQIIFDNFSDFCIPFTICQTFNSADWPFFLDQLIWALLLWNGDQVLTDKYLYLERFGIGSKTFQKVHLEPFWQVFGFNQSVYYRANFYFCWRTLLSESIHTNCVSSKSMTESLEIKLFIWNDLALSTKSSEVCTLNHFC